MRFGTSLPILLANLSIPLGVLAISPAEFDRAKSWLWLTGPIVFQAAC